MYAPLRVVNSKLSANKKLSFKIIPQPSIAIVELLGQCGMTLRAIFFLAFLIFILRLLQTREIYQGPKMMAEHRSLLPLPKSVSGLVH